MKPDYDAVIIGGGHNGLVCACYLARAGLKVRILEARSVIGGAAVTEEFHPGFRNSTASYTVSLLNPQVIKDLHLHEHGLHIIERPLANFLPLPDGGYLKSGGKLEDTQAEFAKFSRRDAENLPTYSAMLERVANVLRDVATMTPPNAGGGLADLWQALKLARKLGKLDLTGQRDVLDLFTKSAAEFLDQWFESEPVKALFGFDAVVGNFASPYTPGSAYVLLHHVFGEVNGKVGAWGHAIGGMGAITQAMQAEAEALGVEVSLDSPVGQVRMTNGRANGVQLITGETIHARRIIANVNPKLLFDRLVSPEAVPADFTRRMKGYVCGSGTLRMNVALSELPEFNCLPGTGEHHTAGIIMAPSLDYMDAAYQEARQNGFASKPIVEMLIPSTIDDTLAPKGQHVASLFCQHVNPALANQDAMREQLADTVIETVTENAPNFRQSILGKRVLTPMDLEQQFGLTGGDIFHGRLSLDQLFSARPVLGHGNYRMPVKGLYLCGSGAHPGGGVTGLPGKNAAREILRDV